MDIFEEINKQKFIQEQKQHRLGDLTLDTSSLLLGDIPPKIKTSDYLKSAKGWVYAAVTAIADEIGNIQLKLFRKDKEVKEIPNHAVLDLLFRTNDFTTKFDFFWLISQYLDLTGEAPIFLSYINGQPDSMLLLRPDRLKYLPGNTSLIFWESNLPC